MPRAQVSATAASFKPMPYKILVKVRDDKKLFSGLVIASQKHKDEETVIEADVVSIGLCVDEVKPGDRIIIRGYSGHWVDPGILDDGQTAQIPVYRIIDDGDVMALVESVKKNARSN